MTKHRTSLALVVAAFGTVVLTGPATATGADDDQSEAVASFEKELRDLQFDQVSCQVPPISGNDAVVPELPDSGTSWVVGSVTADVGEETSFTDLTSRIKTGDRLSIVGADGNDQTLVGAVVCSAATTSKPLATDVLEGNFGNRPYAIAVNGVAEERPGLDGAADQGQDQNPVVETDVPAKPASPSGLLLGLGGVLAGAGALAVIRRRALSRR